ncbi:MAG: hypothetical protein IH989_05365 [Planctomycetes bacterium]|nr:hypothetical protein [Planctomycetota bacterium]
MRTQKRGREPPRSDSELKPWHLFVLRLLLGLAGVGLAVFGVYKSDNVLIFVGFTVCAAAAGVRIRLP